MLNHIVIMGRLTRDPDVRYTQQNLPIARFTVAVDRDNKNENGQRATDFIDCVAWRSTAEFVQKYFTKGTMAVVSGRLGINEWTDRDGNKRRNAEITVDNIYFGESKRRDENNTYGTPAVSGNYSPESVSAGVNAQSPFAEIESGDEDQLPF